MNAKPEVTEEDILNSMNFEKVLSMVASHKLHQKTMWRRLRIFLSVAAILLAAGYGYQAFLADRPQRPAIVKGPATKVTSVGDSVVARWHTSPPRATTKPVQHPSPPAKPSNDKRTESTAVYVPAEPRDGFPALYEYFDRELKYPPEAMADSVRGVVTITVVIDEEGRAGTFTILHSLNPACDKEALRVVARMPAWKAATLDGRAVASRVTIPLTFSFQPTRK